MANSKKTKKSKLEGWVRNIWEMYNAKHKDAMFDAKVGDVFAEDKAAILFKRGKQLVFEYELLDRLTDTDGLPSPSGWKVRVISIPNEDAAKRFGEKLGQVVDKVIMPDYDCPRACYPIARSK